MGDASRRASTRGQRFDGRVALITGGGSGIGRAVVDRFLRRDRPSSLPRRTRSGQEIRELSVQFRAINNKDDVLRSRAVITEKKRGGGETFVVLEVDVVNQNEEQTTPGRAVVVLPTRA